MFFRIFIHYSTRTQIFEKIGFVGTWLKHILNHYHIQAETWNSIKMTAQARFATMKDMTSSKVLHC